MSGVEQQSPTTGFSMVLTPRAAEEVQKFITQEQVPAESAGLRVSVLPGGCSGFKYSLNIEERPLEDDMVARDQRRPGLRGRVQRPVSHGHHHRLRDLDAGLRLHVQQPQRHWRVRVRQQLYCVSRKR